MTTKALPAYLIRMFAPGLFLLLVPGLLRSYLLMPFPGSQDLEAIGLAYFLERTLLVTRIAGAILVLPAVIDAFLHRGVKAKIVMGIAGVVSFLLAVLH